MEAPPEIRYVKIIPDPPESTLMEIYVYDPLDYLAVKFLQGSLFVLFIAVVVDVITG